jgi:hypothetical protein
VLVTLFSTVSEPVVSEPVRPAEDGAAVAGSSSGVVPAGELLSGAAGGACRVGAAQDTSAAIVAKIATVRHTFDFTPMWLDAITKGYSMFWIFLELALGLALFVFLVWWTLPKKDKGDPPE